MSVGVPMLDESHREFADHLIEIADTLHRHSFETARKICQSMVATSAAHAVVEEALLRRLGYPGLESVIKVQEDMGGRLQRLLALIDDKSEDALAYAIDMIDAFVAYLLRSDINFKSFLQEMRDTGRLTEPPPTSGGKATDKTDR